MQFKTGNTTCTAHTSPLPLHLSCSLSLSLSLPPHTHTRTYTRIHTHIHMHTHTHTHTHVRMHAHACTCTRTHLIQIIHEHLPHLVDGYSGIDRTLQLQSAHEVRQEPQVRDIGEAQQHRINLVYVPTETRHEQRGRSSVPQSQLLLLLYIEPATVVRPSMSYMHTLCLCH